MADLIPWKFCPSCKKMILGDGKPCPYCGAKMDGGMRVLNEEDKLFELLCESEFMDWDRKIEYLIANGVTIPVRCEGCRDYTAYGYCPHMGGHMKPDGYCSLGRRRSDRGPM